MRRTRGDIGFFRRFAVRRYFVADAFFLLATDFFAVAWAGVFLGLKAVEGACPKPASEPYSTTPLRRERTRNKRRQFTTTTKFNAENCCPEEKHRLPPGCESVPG